MKKIVLVISSFFIIGIAAAQSNYIVHTIKDGETLTKLANKYGTTVGDIMRLNQMTTSSKLSIGEEVKIPTSQASKETTHVVAKGETLYSIAKKNHITVAQLRDWNNIPDNTIKDGQTLRLTAPDNNSTKDDASNIASSSQEKNTSAADNSASANTVAASQISADDNAKQRSSDAETETSQTSVNNNPDEGVFGVTYQSKANGTELITKGTASIFKSASGWEDKKYYILMNDIAPGTIVKVQANGKTVYAKVLWNLGNVKENQGLSYRISDAAASVLNLSGNTFDIIVSYYK
ncbi:MAG: LysM peptidoglycan-binding domain-containing protein [Arachidicoccus sp.]|nr:LysM peptidoglycan-binding domain-containing protein [Arachidicoccus sp.]